MNFTESKIRRMADGEIYPFAQATTTFIQTLAEPHPNWVDYGILPLDLTESLARAAAFRDLIGSAKNVDDNVGAIILDLEAKKLRIERRRRRFYLAHEPLQKD
jgi:hypothetical protein